jgi:3-oxoacyl-[acyl-carrier protein] reductase
VKLEDQTIMISGAAGAVGFYFVRELGRAAKKIIALDNNQAKLSELKEQTSQAEYYQCDLTNFEQTEQTTGKILQAHDVTVLINLAGLIHSEPLVNLLNKENSRHSIDNWDRIIKANLYSTFFLSSLVAEAMVKKRTKGLIINTSSIAAQGNPGQSAYAAAKAGIESMTRVWSKELGPFKIRCACIAPGFLDTHSTHESLNETIIEKWKRQIPIGKLGEPGEFLGAVKFIISNDYFNGKTLQLDGGLNIG